MNPDPSTALTSQTLGALAELVGGRLEGDQGLPFAGIAPVEEAGPTQIAFLSAKRYARWVEGSRAAAFLVSEEMERWVADRPRVVVAEPHRALVTLLRTLERRPPRRPGIHPTAVLGEGVRLGEGVSVGPYAVLGEGVVVGEGSTLGAHVVVGDRVEIGRDAVLHPHVVLYPETRLGDRVIVHSGTVLGSDGFGYAYFGGAHQRIPHLGRAVIGDDVEVGANSCVDRGSIGDTVVESGVKIDNLVQIAHNVRVGALSMLAALVGIAGSTRVGKGVWFGGQVGVINHLDVGDGARLAVATKVMRDVKPGETLSGFPARPHREDMNRQALVNRLPRLMDRVRELEARVEALSRPSD